VSLIQLEGLGAVEDPIEISDLLGLGTVAPFGRQLVQIPESDMGGFGYTPSAYGDDDDDPALAGLAGLDDLGFLDTLLKVAGGAVGQAFGIPAPIGAAAAGLLTSGIKGLVSKSATKPQKIQAAKQVEQAAMVQLEHLDALEAKLKRCYRKLKKTRRLSAKRQKRLKQAYRLVRVWKKRTRKARKMAGLYRKRYGAAKRDIVSLASQLKTAEQEKMTMAVGGLVVGGLLGTVLARR
jgi:hypothetical protein